MPLLLTLTDQALSRMAIIRNQGSFGPNIGSILAAEIAYIAIIPFAVVEAAFALTALLFAWSCATLVLPMSICIDEGWAPLTDMIQLTAGFMEAFGFSLLWAAATPVMNMLPVRPLETRAQAVRFFHCQNPHPAQ